VSSKPNSAMFQEHTADDPRMLQTLNLPLEPRTVSSLWVDTRLPGPAFDDWRLATRWVCNSAGQPVVAEIRVFPHAGACLDDEGENQISGEWAAAVLGMDAAKFVPFGGMPSSVIRKGIRLQAHQVFVVALTGQLSLSARRGAAAIVPSLSMFAKFTPTRRLDRRVSKAGRPQEWTDARLSKLAIVYDDAVRADKSVVDAVKRKFTISESAARAAIRQAQKRNILPPRSRGERARPMSLQHREYVRGLAESDSAEKKAASGTKSGTVKRSGR